MYDMRGSFNKVLLNRNLYLDDKEGKRFVNPMKLLLEELQKLSNTDLQRATLIQQYILATATLEKYNFEFGEERAEH